MNLEDRKVERDTAIAEIATVLDRLEAERRDPDHWERICLVRALSAVFAGCYSLATAEARLAGTPPDQRSPSADRLTDPILSRCDLSLLTRALHAVMQEPLREFPHLGPVVIVN